MKEQIKTDLNKVARFLEKRKMDFKVVGSIALEVCGLPIGRKPEDIDLEVICSNRQEEIFKALADQYGNNYYTQSEYNLPNCSHKPYIFKFGETKINVWAMKKFTSERFVEKDGIKYAVVQDVLRNKLAYKRAKDFSDLLTIIGRLSVVEGTETTLQGTPVPASV